MKLRVCHLLHRYGRRGLVLIIVGTGWTLYGWFVASDPSYAVARNMAFLSRVIPVGTLGAVWSVCGIAALLAGLMRCGRAVCDAIGFGAACLPPLVWALTYLGAWVIGSSVTGWAQAAAWSVIAAVLLIVSGWPERSR